VTQNIYFSKTNDLSRSSDRHFQTLILDGQCFVTSNILSVDIRVYWF